jgi:hypothetical protein
MRTGLVHTQSFQFFLKQKTHFWGRKLQDELWAKGFGLDVRCWENSGKHVLALSFSLFDPQQTSDIAAEVEATSVPVFQRGPQVAAVAYDPLQAEWVTGKVAFVRTSLSNLAHYAGAGSIEPRRYRSPRGQASRLTGADRGRCSPCARH